MKRLLPFLLFALPLHAGPISWAKRQVREHPTRTEIIGGFISASIGAYGLHECRVNVENCTAHYGAAWASYGAAEGGHALAILIGYKIGGKTGAAIAHGSNFLDAGYGAWEWHGGLNKPKEKSDEERNTHLPQITR